METTLTYAEPDPQKVEELSRKIGCHPVIAALLHGRGIETFGAADFFCTPPLSS
jgi:hypothetical protein